jgi:acetylornithine/N-succinyldiaminopimelate aminotransferase
MLKLARRHFQAQGQTERMRVVAFDNSFHGRTLGALAATGQTKYRDGFGPLPGVSHVPYGDLDAVRAAMGPDVAGIIVEPIQGEGGVLPAPAGFLAGLRAIADEHGALLLADEVQTGIGRTGEIFAYERSGIAPDIKALAKALGGGFPIGACLATTEASKGMTAGTHGSTFGGNPLAMAVGNAVLDVVLEPEFIEHVRQISLRLKQRLAELKDRHASVIAEVRGEGLLIGLRLIPPAGTLVDELRAENMITVAAGDNVVRLLPPLIISEEEIGEAVAKIDRACARLAQVAKPAKEAAS